MYFSLLLTRLSFLDTLREADLNQIMCMPPFSDLVISSFCLHRHLNLNNFFMLLSFPHYLHNYHKALPTFLLLTQTLPVFFFFDPSLCFYRIIFLGKKMVDFRVNPKEGRGIIQLLC